VALYEIVLRFREREEVRLADRNGYVPGQRVLIGQRVFVVLGTEPPELPGATERVVLLAADG